MKRKSKGKKILIAVICLVLVAAIGAGAWFAVGSKGGEPVNVFPCMYVGMTEYWGDSQESYGFVQTDGVQTVYLSGTQTVTEIFVEMGQEVKKGDVLMSFDTTLSDLALERKRLDVEKLKLQLEDAKQRLREINAMRPMVIPQPSDKPDEEVDLGKLLTDPYFISEKTEFDGSTAEKALICWLHSGTAIEDSIFEALLLKAREYQPLNEEEPEEPGEEATEPSEVPTEAPSEPSEPPTEPEEPEEINKYFVVFKVTEGNYTLAAKTAWQGVFVIRDENTGAYSFKFYDAGLVPDHTLAPDEEAEEE
ncbi:MAG: efflux RND transporter periplasmic adaptor subunit [Ruminiclostridium sp.]|nr:efflux RND transporter periplasmic adaptor subunit [Ruminiclostridium sp.]